MVNVTPFRIDIPDSKIDDIHQRVTRWAPFPAPDTPAPWQYGLSQPSFGRLVAYWRDQYSWRDAERELNAYPHFVADLDGTHIHFMHIQGEAGGRRPLLLTHGWPGSFYEFWQVIGPLAWPSKFGGTPDDAFDLIIPSLPGYGFSGKPPRPLGQRATAHLWDRLMREGLGYTSYLAQGGDWGSLVTGWLGVDWGHAQNKGGCRAIHLNMAGLRPTPLVPQTEAELTWLQTMQAAQQAEGAYFAIQATKPQTLATALMDSPVGTAAWIFEKFHAWSDLRRGDVFSVYSEQQLITNIMIYLVNDAIATSIWYYAALFEEGGGSLPEGQRCETPTGFANFPGEKVYSPPPRSLWDRTYNMTYWRDMAEGGHFAAMEKPDLFVDTVRDWARAAG